jgi:integrase
MAKRTNGTGAVYKDKARGTWIGEAWIDGKRRRVSRKTKTDASAAISRLIRDAERGEVTVDGNQTVQHVLDLWRQRTLANRELEPKSRENYQLASRVLGEELGKVRLRSLDVERIERGIDAIATGKYGRGRPLSRRSLKLYRATLAQALDMAVRRKLLASNPAEHAELTPTAAKSTPRRALNEHDAQRLWDALDGERLGPALRLMLLTGMRPGEVYGACWDKVDVAAGTLDVHRAVRVERGRARLVQVLKTDSSYRTIRLPAPAIELLRQQKPAVAAMKLAARTWAVDDPGLCFPTVNGSPWNPKNGRAELQRICADAGLDYVRPHELRHTCATLLNDRGVPLELIADLLGHAGIDMLSRVYRHRVRPSADAAVETMGSLFGGRGEATGRV